MNEDTIEFPQTETRTVWHYYKDRFGTNQVASYRVNIIPGFPCDLVEVARKCHEDQEYRKSHAW